MYLMFMFVTLMDLSAVVYLQKFGHPDYPADEMRNNLTVLMSTVERMQFQYTNLDLQQKLQEKVLKEQASNISQQQAELRVMESKNSMLNQTIELQQQILTEQRQNLSRLARKEVLLDHLMDEINSSRSLALEFESNKHHLSRLEERVNQTASVYDMILYDIVNKLNVYRNETEENLRNFARDIADMNKQFRYVSLSTLGATNQLTALNKSLSTWLQQLDKMHLHLNSSTTLSMSTIRQRLQDLNSSLDTRLQNVEKNHGKPDSSTVSSLNELRNQLNQFNTTLYTTTYSVDGIRQQLIHHNTILSSTTNSVVDIRQQVQHLNANTQQSYQDIQRRMEVMNASIMANIGGAGDIAFTASLNSELRHYNYRRVAYDKVISNVGNAYNPGTGIFKCPKPGTYVFTWTVLSYQRESCETFIYRNGVRLLEALSQEGVGSIYEVASNTAVLSLGSGDSVWIQTVSCAYYHMYPYTSFSGWKL